MDRLVLILLGLFLLIHGIMAVTNLQVTWMVPIAGFSALAAGAVCLIRGLK